MKWQQNIISGQNIYLKFAIFATGVVTGIEASLRQLIAQVFLLLLFFILEPPLYSLTFSALRRVLPFFAAYWVFATLFQQNFPNTVQFSIQLIYLLIITVAVLGRVSMNHVAAESYRLRKIAWVNSVFYYLFATWLYVQSFFRHYQLRQHNYASEPIVSLLEGVINAVSGETGIIRVQLREILASDSQEVHLFVPANVCGVLFLVLLIIVNGL